MTFSKNRKSFSTPLELLFAFILTFLLLTSCRPAGFIYTEEGKIECGADGQPIVITNNATAADPTFAALVAFIRADATDARKYIEGAFVCADFAEALHNNAEAAGIRAAWVSLDFEGTAKGHALNAFETSDRGLVFIDCTNSSSPGGSGKGWDAVAYISIGKKYGVLPVEHVLSADYDFYRLEYDFYADCAVAWQEFETQLKAYNEEVDRYNRETGNRVFIIGSPDWRRVTAWKEELIAQEKGLADLRARAGERWLESEYSSYLVKSVNIHW